MLTQRPHRASPLVRGRRVLVLLAVVMLSRPALGAACPKLLMFDGIRLQTQATPRQAAYWGLTIGIQGAFLNGVMPYWSADVGTNPASAMWQKARQFQTDYARYGVTDNFIKVALYKHHDWRSATQNAAVVKHFAHAAALARYAGFKGIAIDLEPYTPTWGSSADVGALDATVKQEGRAIAEAMHGAYPDMTLFVLPDVLSEIHHHQRNLMQRLASTYHQLRTGATASKEGYALAPAFLHGLLSVPWKHVVIGMEQTYSRNADGIATSVSPDYQRYAAFLAQDGESDAALSMAPGLWPLGPNSHSRAARETPERFAERLRVSMSLATQYVWIYGKGGTWWANAPTIAAPMAPNFPQFVAAIHAVRATCRRSGPIAAPRPDRH